MSILTLTSTARMVPLGTLTWCRQRCSGGSEQCNKYCLLRELHKCDIRLGSPHLKYTVHIWQKTRYRLLKSRQINGGGWKCQSSQLKRIEALVDCLNLSLRLLIHPLLTPVLSLGTISLHPRLDIMQQGGH